MSVSTTVSGVLFACTHCHKRVKFEELSTTQQLCKECRKRYPLVTCTYCRLEFHPVRYSAVKDSRPACDHCTKDFKQYGTPSFCVICNLQSAFNSRKCTRCSHSEKKYGAPVACEQCKMVCAFNKPEDVKKKVDGKILCLLCTINFKKSQFKRKLQEGKRDSQNMSNKPQKRGDTRREEASSASKKMKLELPSSSDASSSPQFLSSLREPQQLDVISSNHLLETDRLYNEITSLKKQLAQKEQNLLDKDKQICQLKAENMDIEKESRKKLQSLQRMHMVTLETLQSEIRALKKQLSQSSHKSSSSSTKSSNQTSAQASLAAALTGINSTS